MDKNRECKKGCLSSLAFGECKIHGVQRESRNVKDGYLYLRCEACMLDATKDSVPRKDMDYDMFSCVHRLMESVALRLQELAIVRTDLAVIKENVKKWKEDRRRLELELSQARIRIKELTAVCNKAIRDSVTAKEDKHDKV